MKSFKEFFFGKEITKEIDVGISTATIILDSGEIKRVTRKGYTSSGEFGFTETSWNLLARYFRGERNFIITDDEEIIPVHKIAKVSVKTEKCFEKYSYMDYR